MCKKDNIEFFKNEVNSFIDFFGLNDWEIYIEDDDDDSILGVLECDGMDSNRLATIRYSNDWISSKETTKYDISKTAFHEVMELLLIKLRSYSNNTELLVSEREIDEEVHRIIRTFENTILKIIRRQDEEV